jgi:hypothetical protein
LPFAVESKVEQYLNRICRGARRQQRLAGSERIRHRLGHRVGARLQRDDDGIRLRQGFAPARRRADRPAPSACRLRFSISATSVAPVMSSAITPSSIVSSFPFGFATTTL